MADFDWPCNLKCPHCNALLTESVSWRYDHPGAPCVACGKPVSVVFYACDPESIPKDPIES
jgi:hypothetical protein